MFQQTSYEENKAPPEQTKKGARTSVCRPSGTGHMGSASSPGSFIFVLISLINILCHQETPVSFSGNEFIMRPRASCGGRGPGKLGRGQLQASAAGSATAPGRGAARPAGEHRPWEPGFRLCGSLIPQIKPLQKMPLLPGRLK